MVTYILNTFLWPWPLAYFWKSFNIVLNFLNVKDGAFIFGMSVLSDGTIKFEHVTLPVTFDLLVKKTFNTARNLFSVSIRAYVFGMCVPYDKTFALSLNWNTLPWP